MAVEPEEQARADMYALLARMLHAAPDAEMLSTLASADAIVSGQSGHPLDRAWERLVLAAGVMDESALAEEFNALFISVGSPKINPYASLYMSGFINEKPLVVLRSDLARLGLARAPGKREMEDHLAALCEAMRLMIVGGTRVATPGVATPGVATPGVATPGAAMQPLARQRQFFDTHIAPWYRRCLQDIRSAPEANFYRLVADFMQAFFDVEAEAFALGDECETA